MTIKSTKTRLRVNLTIDAEIMETAKDMKLNASRAAEDGIRRAIAEEKGRLWKIENREAILAYNERIAKHGTILKSYWLEEE